MTEALNIWNEKCSAEIMALPFFVIVKFSIKCHLAEANETHFCSPHERVHNLVQFNENCTWSDRCYELLGFCDHMN